MAELPEILILSQQMSKQLAGKVFAEVEIRQEKCLNMDTAAFSAELQGKEVIRAYNRGKWIFLELSEGYHLLVNVGMGGDVYYYAPGDPWSNEYQGRFHFTDESGFTCKFWWFGHLELIRPGELAEHTPTVGIQISPLDPEFTLEYLRSLLVNTRTRIKVVLLDQKKIGGIGNVYIHDILFRTKLHPLTPAKNLTDEQIALLYQVMRENLQAAYDKRGLAYERDLYGQSGGYERTDFLIGYCENQPCPVCGTTIEKIKTGSTSTFVCTTCQVL